MLVLDQDIPRGDGHWEKFFQCTQDEMAMHGLQKISLVAKRCLRPVSSQENNPRIGPDRNKI